MYKVPSGISMPCSNLKPILPVTLMTPSLSQNLKLPKLMIKNTSKLSRMFMRKEVSAVKDMPMNGIQRKPTKIYSEPIQLPFLLAT